MAKLFNAIKKLTAAPDAVDENATRRRIRELEAENKILRDKLVWRGPWML
jgi:hypothetical protein